VQVVNIPNSMTVLPELLPYSIEMVRHLPISVTIKCLTVQQLTFGYLKGQQVVEPARSHGREHGSRMALVRDSALLKM